MSDQSLNEDFVVGRVVEVSPLTVNQNLLQGAGLVSKQQIVKVKILEGPYKDLVASVSNDITDNPAYNVNVGPGREVILSIVGSNSTKPEVNIADYHRAPVIYALL